MPSLPLKVLISGVHSDVDPSPGLGIARSLRHAYPQAELCAIDYSLHSSGLHDPVFNQVRPMPAWSDMDLEVYLQQIAREVQQPGTFRISGLDAEVHWLATRLRVGTRILVPELKALQNIRKPELKIADDLGMRIPEFGAANLSPRELHAFGRRSGWQLWVKGCYHEALAAGSFLELQRQIEQLEQTWPLDEIFVQQHVHGLERSLTFAAFQGELLGLVEIEKSIVTAQGKTWGASVLPVTAEQWDQLATLVRKLNWTGGGEIEFVRDARQVDWLIDVNPRFPAYIHGVTLSGLNLPALLISAALVQRSTSRTPLLRTVGGAKQFVRVVQEIAVRHELPLLPPLHTGNAMSIGGKHPSLQPALVRKMRLSTANRPPVALPRTTADLSAGQMPTLFDSSISAEILAETGLLEPTPVRMRTGSTLALFLSHLEETIKRCAPSVTLIPAMSVKTDPHQIVAAEFLRRGWFAETISAQEREWALEQGFDSERIILNGPTAVKTAIDHQERTSYCFADSVTSFVQLCHQRSLSGRNALPANGSPDWSEAGPAPEFVRHAAGHHGWPVGSFVGFRFRPSQMKSRFGIDFTDYENFLAVNQLDATVGLGIHLHLPADALGPVRWRKGVDEALHWASTLERLTGRVIRVFDLGGGWSADDFLTGLLPTLERLAPEIRRRLPHVEPLIIEPGKALASGTAWLKTTILEVRDVVRRSDEPGEPGEPGEPACLSAQLASKEANCRRVGSDAENRCQSASAIATEQEQPALQVSKRTSGQFDVVVDASIADLPMAQLEAHGILHVRDGAILGWLTGGLCRILGAICMEGDLLAREIAFPRPPQIGDELVFSGAGAYNASMAWPFARGVSRDS